MTPKKREELTKNLAAHGLSVLLTRDFDSILIQLARLAQSEQMVEATYGEVPYAREALQHIRQQQAAPPNIPDPGDMRPMVILDIPTTLNLANRALHDQLDKQVRISPLRMPAAVAAFVGILCAEAH